MSHRLLSLSVSHRHVINIGISLVAILAKHASKYLIWMQTGVVSSCGGFKQGVLISRATLPFKGGAMWSGP
eukprot:2510836-Karenia_brevis.AAC.1